MPVRTKAFRLETQGHTDVIDITAQVAEAVEGDGVAVVFISGSTAGITTIEFEPGLVKDIREAFEKIAPEWKNYHHHEKWNDGNGSAHVRASILGPSLTVPVVGGKLKLGQWQQIVLVDFDTQPRTRDVTVQL